MAAIRTPRARTPGRPVTGGADVRERLLDAALACFVRDGIAATSLRRIAIEAGVTPAMLHYYFGDKEQLLTELAQERIAPAVTRVRESLLAAGDDIHALVVAFVRGMMRSIEANPWLPALWVREVLAEGGGLRDHLVNVIGPQVPRMLAERFAAARRRGHIPRDVDPALLVTSLVGMTMFPAAGAPVWMRMFPGKTMSPRAIERHAIAMLEHGLGLEDPAK
ncbi:MAG: TetR/AcrR family transcriptional regulator [Proteobacteria bacterium]|nr:TetR/AcrR family transcriptional regulator [Pseudomonadota bacterium]